MNEFRTEKGKEGIGYMGHVYRFAKRGADGSLYWRCLLRDDCRGRLQTDANKGRPQLRTEHCHAANDDEVRVRSARERLRQRAEQETAPAPEIYRQEILKLAQYPGSAARMPAYDSVSTTMYRDRHSNMPPLPTSLQALVVPPQFCQTLAGQPFLMCSGTGNKFLLFTTADNLTRLCSSTTIYMDGTFDTAPHLFTQLYTIHAFVGERLIPFVFALLADKTANTYTEMFTALRQCCNQHGQQLQPGTIMTDFESSVIPVIQQEFPASRHKGCHFHFTQVSDYVCAR